MLLYLTFLIASHKVIALDLPCFIFGINWLKRFSPLIYKLFKKWRGKLVLKLLLLFSYYFRITFCSDLMCNTDIKG